MNRSTMHAPRWLGVAACIALLVTQVHAFTSNFHPMTQGAVAGVWTTDLNAAMVLANANNRPLIVYVGNTRACAYCHLAEENVFLTSAWLDYAAARGMPLVYIDDILDLRYIKFISGTTGQTPVMNILMCPTPTTYTVLGRFVYRWWDAYTSPTMIYNGIKGVYDPPTWIAIVESYYGGPIPLLASVSAAPNPLSVSSNSQDQVVNVTASGATPWTAATSTGWISFPGTHDGAGNGAFTIHIAQNGGIVARTGTVTVASFVLTVIQAPYQPNALLTVTLAPQLAADSGGHWSTDGGTTWFASGATNALPPGSYTVTYQAVAGWTTPASAGAALTVAQAVTPLSLTGTYQPVIAFSPPSITTNSVAQDVDVDVTAPSGFGWTALSSAAWLTFVGPNTGTGSDTLTLHLDTNGTGSVRSGTVTVGARVLNVSQQPSGGTGPVVIQVQPKSQKVLYGQKAVLSVAATGAAPITYQWTSIYGFNVSGATRATFTTGVMTATTSYRCRITNPQGTVTSGWGTLTVVRMLRAIAGNAVSIGVVPASATAKWTLTETLPSGLTPTIVPVTGVTATWTASTRKLVFTGIGAKTARYTVAGADGTYTVSGTTKWTPLSLAVATQGDTVLVLSGVPVIRPAPAAGVRIEGLNVGLRGASSL